MARRGGNPRISIQADADGVGRATRQAAGDLDRLDKTGSKSLSGLKSAVAVTSAALVGGLVLGTKEAAQAAIESEKANARLQAQLKALGISYDRHEKQIQRVIDKHSQLSGFDDEDLGDSFTNIVRVVGDVNKALDLNVIAMDFARAKNIDVAKAGELVGKVAGGNTGILSRYGIQVEKGATATEALGLLQEKFSGQAEKYGKTTAGSADRAKVAFENLGETLGAKVTPLIADAADGIAELVRQYTLGEGPGGRIRAVVEGVGSAASAAAGGVRSLATGFQQGDAPARILAGSIAGLASGFLAFKVGGAIVAGLTATAGGIRAITAAMKANPFGLALGAITGLIGVVTTLTASTRDNSLSQRELNDVYRAQVDAIRQIRDIDIDAAQRRANLRSANVAVEAAEKSLTQARKEYGKRSIEARQAEANLEQAVVSQKRARREAARVEEDATSTRRKAREEIRKNTDQLRKHNDQVDEDIRSAEGQIKAIERRKNMLRQQYGPALADTMDKAQGLTRQQEKLREEIGKLRSRKVSVTVNFKLAPAPGSVYGSQVPQGDGAGVAGVVQNMAQHAADTGRLLPAGPANLRGADPDLAPFASIGAGFGLATTSGLRPGSVTSSGNRSYHASGDAIDMAGAPGAMLGFFGALKRTFGGSLRELIYTPGGVGIKDGRPHTYTGEVAQDHYDHVHVAYTGPFGDGIGQAANAARAAGFRGRDLLTAIAIAGPESGFVNRKRNNSSIEDSRGMTQINVRAHPWARSLNLYDAFVNYRAARRVWREAGGSFRPWTGFTSGDYRAFLDDARRAVRSSRKRPKPKPGGRVVEFGPNITGTPADIGFDPDSFVDVGSPSGSGGGDPGPSPSSPVDTGAAELAAQLKRMNDFNDWLVNTQGPTLIGAVVAAVNGGIGGPVGLGFQGLRSAPGSTAGL